MLLTVPPASYRLLSQEPSLSLVGSGENFSKADDVMNLRRSSGGRPSPEEDYLTL